MIKGGAHEGAVATAACRSCAPTSARLQEAGVRRPRTRAFQFYGRGSCRRGIYDNMKTGGWRRSSSARGAASNKPSLSADVLAPPWSSRWPWHAGVGPGRRGRSRTRSAILRDQLFPPPSRARSQSLQASTRGPPAGWFWVRLPRPQGNHEPRKKPESQIAGKALPNPRFTCDFDLLRDGRKPLPNQQTALFFTAYQETSRSTAQGRGFHFRVPQNPSGSFRLSLSRWCVRQAAGPSSVARAISGRSRGREAKRNQIIGERLRRREAPAEPPTR